ncbi:MAG TPA: 16S rRNA (guanine(966)-N(2))-methyltransferase RsmD [Terriglobales bacterium]|nr:16S rRNA (guanine(966)-N(2))-methyltransferase RsmD [Terriglobales bacterium]
MRIIGGKYRSRHLKSLPGLDLRPTSDRLRETLFNVLTAGNSQALSGSTWLDLYAGTGAVGIEVLSRGAVQVVFVEDSKQASNLIRQNLHALGIQHGFEILDQDATKALRRLEARGAHFSYCFLDPPYRLREQYARTLETLSQSTLITAESLVIAEHEKKFDPGDAFGSLQRVRRLVQGDAALSFYRRTSG